MRSRLLICVILIATSLTPWGANASETEIEPSKQNDGTAQLDWRDCQAGRKEARIAACTRIIVDPGQPEERRASAYFHRGRAFDRQGVLPRAVADYTEAIRLDPNDDAAYTNRGLIRHNSGDLDGVIADYTKAIRIDPSDSTAYNNRGNAWRQKGQLERALIDGTQAIRLDPTSAFAHHSRGLSWAAAGDLDQAISDLTEAIRIDPKDALAYYNRGRYWLRRGDLDRAIADFDEALARDPSATRLEDELVELHRDRGHALFLKRDFQQSAASLARAIELDPGSGPDVLLFWYVARARAGDGAAAELQSRAARLNADRWPYPIIRLFLDRITVAELLATPRTAAQQCDALYFVGLWRLLKNSDREGDAELRKAAEICPEASIKRASARRELARFEPTEVEQSWKP